MRIKLLFTSFVFIACYCMSFAINPMKEYKMKPNVFEIKYEEKKIPTLDGALLNTWIMNTAEKENTKDCTIIITGSDAGNMGYSLAYAANLLAHGYDVITYDYRGFGESSDFDFNANNVYHSEYIQDFNTIINWTSKNKRTEKIAVLSFSMGTLIATAGYQDSKYDLLIAEGFIQSPCTNRKRIKKLKGKKLSLPKGHKKHGKAINNLNIPILVFSSKNDPITTLEDSKKIVSKKKNRKLVEFDGEHLRGAFTMGMDNYIKEINLMNQR